MSDPLSPRNSTRPARSSVLATAGNVVGTAASLARNIVRLPVDGGAAFLRRRLAVAMQGADIAEMKVVTRVGRDKMRREPGERRVVRRPALLARWRFSLVLRWVLTILWAVCAFSLPAWGTGFLILIGHACVYLFRGSVERRFWSSEERAKRPWRMNVGAAVLMVTVDVAWLALTYGLSYWMNVWLFGLAFVVFFLAFFVSVYLAWLVDKMFVTTSRLIIRTRGLGIFSDDTKGKLTGVRTSGAKGRMPTGHAVASTDTDAEDDGPLKSFGPARWVDAFTSFVLDPNQIVFEDPTDVGEFVDEDDSEDDPPTVELDDRFPEPPPPVA